MLGYRYTYIYDSWSFNTWPNYKTTDFESVAQSPVPTISFPQFKADKKGLDQFLKDNGYKLSKNRIERLYYTVMGLRAIMPGKHTSRRHKAHKVYPYLLRNLRVDRPNQA